MSSNTNSGSDSKDAFDAAKHIVAALEGVKKEHQDIAIRFAMEMLGIQSPTTTSRIQQLKTPEVSTADDTMKTTDIKSFVAAKSPKSNQQFAAVVAYFYQFESAPTDRKDSIDVDTIKHAARLAGWAQSKNWIMTLHNATNAGYLDKVERGSFKLNSVGENLVAITLPGNSTAGHPTGKVQKKSTRRGTKNPLGHK